MHLNNENFKLEKIAMFKSCRSSLNDKLYFVLKTKKHFKSLHRETLKTEFIFVRVGFV